MQQSEARDAALGALSLDSTHTVSGGMTTGGGEGVIRAVRQWEAEHPTECRKDGGIAIAAEASKWFSWQWNQEGLGSCGSRWRGSTGCGAVHDGW